MGIVPSVRPLENAVPYVTIGRPVNTRSKIAVMARKTAKPYHVARRRSMPADHAQASAPARTTRPASVYSGIRRRLVRVAGRVVGRPRGSLRPPETLEQHDREQGEECEEQWLLDRDPGRHAGDDPVRARGEPAPAGADDVEGEEH